MLAEAVLNSVILKYNSQETDVYIFLISFIGSLKNFPAHVGDFFSMKEKYANMVHNILN